MRKVWADGKQPPAFVLGFEHGMGQAVIEIMPARQEGPRPDTFARSQPGLRHLAFRVADFDQAYRTLKTGGVRFAGEPGEALGGGRIVSFYDPEGNELQIVQR